MLTLRDNSSSANAPWVGFKLWYYTPSIAAAVLFIIFFVTLTSYHTFLLIRRRTWFCVPFVVGGAFEIIGYVCRALAHSHTGSVPIYAAQDLMLLLAPILFAASIYMILGRIIRTLDGEQYSIIRVKWLTRIFVSSDVFCFMVQAAGGSLLSTAKTNADARRSNNIVLGGLILQVAIFMVFVTTAAIFHSRMSKKPTPAAIDGPFGISHGVTVQPFGHLQFTWKKLMICLYTASLLIAFRNVFRAVQFGMGYTSYLLDKKWPLYVLDGMPMVWVLLVCVVWYHPGIAKGSRSGYSMTLGGSGQNGSDGSRPDVEQPKERQGGPWS